MINIVISKQQKKTKQVISWTAFAELNSANAKSFDFPSWRKGILTSMYRPIPLRNFFCNTNEILVKQLEEKKINRNKRAYISSSGTSKIESTCIVSFWSPLLAIVELFLLPVWKILLTSPPTLRKVSSHF